MSGAGTAPGQRTDGCENMYLALLLAAESERLIRLAVPEAGELHLTVLHSPERAVEPPVGTTAAWWGLIADRSIHANVSGVERFGPPHNPVCALQLSFGLLYSSDLSDLVALRFIALDALTDAGVACSKEWGFRPHVSLGPWGVALVQGVLPKKVHFDRLEWRR